MTNPIDSAIALGYKLYMRYYIAQLRDKGDMATYLPNDLISLIAGYSALTRAEFHRWAIQHCEWVECNGISFRICDHGIATVGHIGHRTPIVPVGDGGWLHAAEFACVLVEKHTIMLWLVTALASGYITAVTRIIARMIT